jgi:hypothetical protein
MTTEEKETSNYWWSKGKGRAFRSAADVSSKTASRQVENVMNLIIDSYKFAKDVSRYLEEGRH